MKNIFIYPLFIGIIVLTGCVSQPEKTPDYIGTPCSFNEKSRIIEPYNFYAICKNDKWKAVTAEAFKTYVVKLPDEQIYTSSIIMKDSDMQSDECIYAKQYYNSFRDYDIDGKTIIRNPISKRVCKKISCQNENNIKDFDIRWCN